LGYAFVNLVSNEAANKARMALHGFAEWSVKSSKACHVCWGHPLQGFDACVERYRNSPLMHHLVPAAVKPAVFQNGQRAAFPAPTKAISYPKAKDRPRK